MIDYLTKLNIKPDESAEQPCSSIISSARSSIIWENNTMKNTNTGDSTFDYLNNNSITRTFTENINLFFENGYEDTKDADLEDWALYKYISNNKNTNPFDDVNDDFYVVLPNQNLSFFPTRGSFCVNSLPRPNSPRQEPLMDTEKMVDDLNDEFFEYFTKNDREVIIGTAIENYHLNVFYKSKDCPNDMFQRNLLCDLIQKLKCEVKYDCLYTRLHRLFLQIVRIKFKKQRFTMRTLGGDFGAKGTQYTLSPKNLSEIS